MSGPGAAPAGRRLLLGLQLLDHQIVDRHGRRAGKVDDVELTLPNDEGTDDATGTGGPGRPVVTALLSGNGVLANRLGGPLGRLASTLSRRILPDPDDAGDPDAEAGVARGRIRFGDVTELGNHVQVALDAGDLATHAVEQAVRRTIVGRIPGAREPGA
jgi:hypothetical protein